jgi:hypothetical protein
MFGFLDFDLILIFVFRHTFVIYLLQLTYSNLAPDFQNSIKPPLNVVEMQALSTKVLYKALEYMWHSLSRTNKLHSLVVKPPSPPWEGTSSHPSQLEECRSTSRLRELSPSPKGYGFHNPTR